MQADILIDVEGQRDSKPLSAGETAKDQLCPDTPLAAGIPVIPRKLFGAETSYDEEGGSINKTSEEVSILNLIKQFRELQGNFTASTKRREEESMKLWTAFEEENMKLRENLTAFEKISSQAMELRDNLERNNQETMKLRVEVDLLTFDSALLYAGQLVSKVIGENYNQLLLDMPSLPPLSPGFPL